ncbi:redoxin domain-containing protein [Tumebacillus sp. ITR2]|uniref:thioredoxin-dependent peroxiredoxin n=1 Tax=Tumebacillus amylolyticus TaxID=2801339 RepID=A0ABS1J758_9BACL|nr:redoxin domain-containing protein [Tumebacillus amylolyticus]MBL0386103.1 redoxin domain-containing protein [Tumebacillus amylolyticus]
MLLELGMIAPDFTMDSTQGSVHLYDYKGKKNVLLIFYPLNNTRTCREQLCAARDALPDYAELDTVVLGVNPGKPEKHLKFETRNNFGFPLIYDDRWQLAFHFRIPTLMGLMQARTVYILDRDMRVRYVFRGSPTTHELQQVIQGINDGTLPIPEPPQPKDEQETVEEDKLS